MSTIRRKLFEGSLEFCVETRTHAHSRCYYTTRLVEIQVLAILFPKTPKARLFLIFFGSCRTLPDRGFVSYEVSDARSGDPDSRAIYPSRPVRCVGKFRLEEETSSVVDLYTTNVIVVSRMF